jgi:hypothetical protein
VSLVFTSQHLLGNYREDRPRESRLLHHGERRLPTTEETVLASTTDAVNRVDNTGGHRCNNTIDGKNEEPRDCGGGTRHYRIELNEPRGQDSGRGQDAGSRQQPSEQDLDSAIVAIQHEQQKVPTVLT